MEVNSMVLEEMEGQEDMLCFEEKHAAVQAAFDISCMSPPLSPSPVLSPNTPSQEPASLPEFCFNSRASQDSEQRTPDRSGVPEGSFLTMKARVKFPQGAQKLHDCRLKREGGQMKQGETDEGVQRKELPQGVGVHPRSVDDASEQGEVTLGSKAGPTWSTIVSPSENTGHIDDQERSGVASTHSSEEKPEKEITVDKHSVSILSSGEGSVVDLDIEKLALEIEAHNRAMSNTVMSRFVEVKKKLVQHEQEAVEMARLQHQKELARINDNVACLRAEHAAAVKRAHAMVDMANRAAELVALRSQQTRATAILCSFLWRWKEETNWQRYLRRMDRKAAQQYEQHGLQRKPLRKWRELTKIGKLQMQEFKTKMFLKDEKERLASESAGERERLRQEASDLREELARERESREKLEEDMKRAFMRGVCALNIEALSMMKRGGMQAVQDEFDSPNTVVTGPPATKEHVQHYEDVEGVPPLEKEPSAAGDHRATSPGAGRTSRLDPTHDGSASNRVEALPSKESPPAKNSEQEVVGQGDCRQTDTDAPEQRTISEKLKVKLAAVMADSRAEVTRNGATAGGELDGGASRKSVDVRSQNGSAVVARRRESMKRVSEVQLAKGGVLSGVAGPRWS